MGDSAPAHAAATRPFWRSRRAANLGMALLALAALGAFYDELPDFGAMLAAITRADPAWLAVVVIAEAASMGAFARLQRRLLRIGGVRISLRRAFAVTYAGNALSTTLPAGPAVSIVYTFRQFRFSGASAQVATAVILIGGIITSVAYTFIGLLALLAVPHTRGLALAALAVPAALTLLLAVVLRRPVTRARVSAVAARAGRAVLAHRRVAPHAERLREGRGVLRPSRRDWAPLLTMASLNWLADILALYAAARAVGVEVGPHWVTLAYFAAQAAGSVLPLLPGGLGAIETSMAATLVAFGATLAPAAAAVGLYRLVSYWVVVAIGWLAWIALHEGPRLSERTRERIAGAGRAALRGCTSAALLTPYAPLYAALTADPKRTRASL
ncbi:lysylphosphatidylglycerol synthase transmembrane domain-containing protein [Spirillospora sp. CA-294931]|uniref:lysylphosphatidylglycerol synthase transmembrane domain-containing protein n=1 Tax=Spirillospora sp. CA-294931 TaxID=3240042 RepID=UPI003D8EF364